MKNEQLYRETVDIILDAYNERKLEHADACGCFIGNIVAKKANPKADKIQTDNAYSPDWFLAALQDFRRQAIYTFRRLNINKGKFDEFEYSIEEGLKQIEATGYTIEEVDRLETAFEGAAKKEEQDEFGNRIGQLEGMKAALIELANIHETEAEESLVKLDKIHEKVYA